MTSVWTWVVGPWHSVEVTVGWRGLWGEGVCVLLVRLSWVSKEEGRCLSKLLIAVDTYFVTRPMVLASLLTTWVESESRVSGPSENKSNLQGLSLWGTEWVVFPSDPCSRRLVTPYINRKGLPLFWMSVLFRPGPILWLKTSSYYGILGRTVFSDGVRNRKRDLPLSWALSVFWVECDRFLFFWFRLVWKTKIIFCCFYSYLKE